jgi:hypothetical protein
MRKFQSRHENMTAMEDALPSIVNRHGTTNRSPGPVAPMALTR